MCKYIRVSFFLVWLIFFFLLLMFSAGLPLFSRGYTLFKNYFIFDNVAFYLIVLVSILGIYTQISFYKLLSNSVRVFLLMRLIFSILCFCIKHSILFWCFYELRMLPLLYLIFGESPYSERFFAGWYFAAYLLITSLPLILIILYLSLVNGSFFFNEWCRYRVNIFIFVVLSFIFFTKVPLFPFHTWLPMVHAEATSIVSIFLRGYIMKLGLLGVYRCSFFIFKESFVCYLFICCLFSIFFFVTSSSELDGKRWLAFLRLAHIVVPFLGLFISDWIGVNFAFLYCLGHGVSAGLVFGLLWYFYDLSNRRNWLLLKSRIKGKVAMLVIIFSLLTLCSFPPTIQFFCEVNLIGLSSGLLVYILFWSIYLFLGGLVPLVLCGHLLVRNEYFEEHSCSTGYSFIFFLFYLCLWCYWGMLLL